ncbi:MAG: polysaccharide lyase family 8 super-sandwich domain-containing protein [Verrucomicrobiota bacterium]
MQPHFHILRYLILLFALQGANASTAQTDKEQELQTLRERFARLYNSYSDDLSTREYLNTLRDDGTWAGIDYESGRRAKWPALEHLTRLQTMAATYANKDSSFFKDPDLLEGIESGYQHWFDGRYKNSNWASFRAHAPEYISIGLFLLGEDLSPSLLKQATWSLDRLRDPNIMTGSNRVWTGSSQFRTAIIRGDETKQREAIELILGVIAKTEGYIEGLQPDWSFQQHGPMLQFGVYGKTFAKWTSMLAYLSENLSFEMPADKLELLRGYLLNGAGWTLWNGRIDFNVMGRIFNPGFPALRFEEYRNAMERLYGIDAENRENYEKALAWPNQVTGHRSFWNSDYAVHRRPEWFASVRMTSNRTAAAEYVNSQNALGLHQADGVLLVYIEGDEYLDIQPIWDWHRLPGTTTDQGIEDLTPKGYNQHAVDLGHEFVGTINNGKEGLATMTYEWEGLLARKSWFFLENSILCLGSGITGPSLDNVYTTVQQSWLKGDVESENGIVKTGTVLEIPADSWIHHDDIGYYFHDEAKLESGSKSGDWLDLYPTFSSEPRTGDVFSLWFDHGKNPEEESYAYAIYSKTTAANLETLVADAPYVILANTPDLQAIETADAVMAVFYSPRQLKTESGSTLSSDQPCMMILREDQLIVADPTQTLEELDVTVDSVEHAVTLPRGGYAGQQVEITL